MKFLSDFEPAVNGGWLVEWEYTSGCRFREYFKNKKSAEKAIENNEKYNRKHSAERDLFLLNENINNIESVIDYEIINDGFLVNEEYQLLKIDWYLAAKLNGNEFNLEQFKSVEKDINELYYKDKKILN